MVTGRYFCFSGMGQIKDGPFWKASRFDTHVKLDPLSFRDRRKAFVRSLDGLILP